MARYNKARWANIMCDASQQPYMLIVTDGDRTSEIPVNNTRLSVIKKAASDVYSVPPRHILVTVILPEDDHDKRTC